MNQFMLQMMVMWREYLFQVQVMVKLFTLNIIMAVRQFMLILINLIVRLMSSQQIINIGIRGLKLIYFQVNDFIIRKGN